MSGAFSTYKGATDLYPAQREAIFSPERISIIEASTKAGKTIGCLAWLLEQAVLHGRPGRNFWWVAPVYGQARIGYRRMKRKVPPELYKPNETNLELTFVNGAIMQFRSAEKPDALYGEDVYAAVLDEASRMREESWHAVRSTLTATRGQVRIIGNVRGRKNWFYRLARAAENGAAGMSYHRLTAWDAAQAGVLSMEEVESARDDFERLGRMDVFEQLYMAKAAEDGGNPFGIDAIRRCVQPVTGAQPIVGGVDLAGRGATTASQSEDVGDRGARDYTAIVLLDRNGATSAFSKFQAPHQETEQRIFQRCGRVPLLIDSTGAGDPVVERLQRRGDMRVEGFTFTSRSKQDLMERLAIAIANGEVSFPEEIADELETFEYEYTRTGVRYSAPPGLHDDLVCALALAVWKMPWRRAAAPPIGVGSTSKWYSSPDAEAYRRYQETLKPTEMAAGEQAPAAQEPPPVPMVVGGRASKWTA